MLKFKVGDQIIVTTGKDKGRKGEIERIFPKTLKVLIPGINIYKKHIKSQEVRGGQKAGIYEIPRPLPFSKVALVCPSCKKATRVGFKLYSEEKVRICRKCGKEIKEKEINKK